MSSGYVPHFYSARFFNRSYNRNMALIPRFDWYLKEWMTSLDLSQADLQRLAGWGKRKASELVNGSTRYNRDVINEVCAALNLRPFELLMHPDDAMAIRRFRDSALKLAADNNLELHTEPEPESVPAHGKRDAG